MATHKSAVKEHRQSLARRQRNRFQRSRLRTALKRYRAAIAEGDVNAARELLPASLSLLDTTAKHGAIHVNAASRTKSRLTRALNRLNAAG